MLLTIQFPIADSRQFLAEQTGFLNIPAWAHSVDPERDFVRSFGKIEKRRLGGLKSWIGENSICFAKRAMRFPDQNALNFTFDENQPHIPLRIVFRRFFSDGIATNKFEVGIGTRDKTPVRLSSAQMKKFINQCLEIKVEIPHWNEKVSLADAGKSVASLFLKASTKQKEYILLKPQNWWVESGKPILFLVYSEAENINIPFKIKKIEKLNAETNPYDLAFCQVPWKNGLEIGMWLVKFQNEINYRSIRELRIALLRLYAERQCVRSILRNIGRKRIIIEPKTLIDELRTEKSFPNTFEKNHASDMFQNYWKTAVGRIGSFKRKANTVADALPDEDEISETARMAEDVIEPGERQEILNGLEHIRPNYLRTVENFIIEEFNMNKNEQKNEFGNNATFGAFANEHAEMQGDINQQKIGSDIDMNALIADLTKLREELDKRKSSPDDYVAIGKVAEAEVEAKKGNTSKVWEILKSTGKWVLDTATDIGAKVAVEAIKKSAGL